MEIEYKHYEMIDVQPLSNLGKYVENEYSEYVQTFWYLKMFHSFLLCLKEQESIEKWNKWRFTL